jgi:hypothetical protein
MDPCNCWCLANSMTKQDFEFFAKFAVDYKLPDEAITELLELFKKRNDQFSWQMWWTRYNKLKAM